MTTYWKINSNGERVQMSDEEVAVGISSVRKDTTKTQYIADRLRAPHGDHNKPSYSSLGEQLDMLYKDIDSGKFGEDAKTSSFYLAIKNVKDSSPKPE
jgi:hypothetical protein